MTLTRRLWLLGALVPTLATLGALALAGQLHRYELEASLDRALLTQAAVESVSLFDGPGGRVHLHMGVSPLVEQVRPFAPQGQLFGPDGRLEMHYPPLLEGESVTDIVRPESVPDAPTLSTRVLPDGTRLREVVVKVRSPEGPLYALRLSALLSQVDGAVRGYYRHAFSTAVGLGLVLLSLQTILARRLAHRLGAITRHLTRLREGDFSPMPPPREDADEIGQVHAVLAEATERLRGAREVQERLIADAAHELRTPLALVRTQMDVALRRERSAGELRAALLSSRGEVDRLAVLASELLDLAAARRGTWDRRKADLTELVHQAVEAARAEAEERGLLIHLDAPSRQEAWFDPGGVRQAVDNLLGNALKFSPRGGEIQVRLWHEQERLRLSVTDQGPGIRPEERETVFAPFHKLSGPQRPGAGLGLAIVREVAHRNGGHVWVEPRPPPGAQLILELPAGAPSSPPVPREAEA